MLSGRFIYNILEIEKVKSLFKFYETSWTLEAFFQAPIMKKTKTLFLTWKRFIIDENIISSIQKERKRH
jgi:hypothetical protein